MQTCWKLGHKTVCSKPFACAAPKASQHFSAQAQCMYVCALRSCYSRELTSLSGQQGDHAVCQAVLDAYAARVYAAVDVRAALGGVWCICRVCCRDKPPRSAQGERLPLHARLTHGLYFMQSSYGCVQTRLQTQMTASTSSQAVCCSKNRRWQQGQCVPIQHKAVHSPY